MQNWGQKIFSNREMGMRIYIKTVMILALE
jgi:hypothetical protein